MTLEKLKELLKAGTITQEEYDDLAKAAKPSAPTGEPTKKEEPPRDPNPADPEDLEAKISKAVQTAVDQATNRLGNENKLLKEKLESERKKTLSAEELKQIELQEKEAELEKQQREIQREKSRMYAVKALKKAELDDGSEDALELVEFVLAEDEASIELRVKALQKFAQRIAKNTTDGIYRTNGRDPGKGNAGGAKDNPWRQETWNLTKQMELEINNPELAKTLKAGAGQ